MKSEVKNFLALLLSQGIRFPLNVLSLSILARLLGPADIGKWAMVTSAATILYSVILNWTQGANVRFGCVEWEKSETLRQTWAGRWPIIIVGFLLMLGLLVIQPFGWLEGIYQVPGNWWPIIALYFIILWVSAETQSLLQITRKMNLLAIIPIIIAILSIVYYSLLLFWIKPEGDRLVLVLLGMILISVIGWGTAGVKTFWGTKTGWSRPNRADSLKVISFGWPLVPGFVLGYLSDWGDHLLLQKFFSQYEVGLFQVAYQVMLAIYGMASPLVTVLLPRLIAGGLENDQILVKYVSRVIPTLTAIWMLAIIPMVSLLPTIFIFIMGDKWSAALPFLVVLLITIPGSVISHSYSILFTIQNRLPRVMSLHLIMTIANLTISIILLATIGPLGSAIGTSISYLLSQFMYMSDQHKFMNLPAGKPKLLLFLTLLFGCSQAVIGNHLMIRVIFGISFLTIFIMVMRHNAVADREIIDDIFSGKLKRVRAMTHYIMHGAG